MKSTHSDRLERWLGKEQVESVSASMKDFYYPIPLHGVPGNVFAMPGGGFAGEIKGGAFIGKEDSAATVLKKLTAKAHKAYARDNAVGVLIDMLKGERQGLASVGAFSSIDAVVAAYTGGKGQQIIFQKTGTTVSVVSGCADLWLKAGTPIAGAAAAVAPGGTVLSAASTGALPYNNLGGASTGHYLNWSLTASVASNSLLLYDRMFAVNKTMNSTATEAVTGVPTRYQSTSNTSDSYIGGNFCFPMNPVTVLPATAHNWTVCTYTDHTGAAANFGTIAGITSCQAGQIDLAAGSWFIPLASGSQGVKALTQMQCSALVATGTIEFVIGHPIAINACPIANMACLDDGLYTSMNLTHIEDGACLTFIELPKPATTATNYSGIIRTVSE